jgi:membrane-associated phospholipid phosphatase
LPLLGFSSLVILFVAAHHLYGAVRPDERLSTLTGTLAVMIAAALMAGIVANGGLRLRYDLLDDLLARIDLAAGIDTPALVVWAARHERLTALLGHAYESSFPLCFLTVLWLSLRGDSLRAWQLVLGFAGSIQIAAIVSVFAPALGNIVHAGQGGLGGFGLPPGSGVYHMQAIAAYREGTNPTLDLSNLQGVVTFPSFHMVMALIVAHAWRGRGRFGLAMQGWCVLMVVSTVPIGGHYVIDLAAGTLLWMAIMGLARLPLGGRDRAEAGRLADTASAPC